MDSIPGKNPDNFYLQLVESLPIGILVFDSIGHITFLNNNFLEFCAFHNVEINPSNTLNIFKEDFFPGNSLLNEFDQLKKGYSFEKVLETKNLFALKKLVISVKVFPLFKDEIFEGGILIINDYKIHHEHAEELENFEGRWREILNAAVDLFIITDENGNIKFSFGKKAKKFLSRISPFEKENIDSLFSQETNKLVAGKIKNVKETKAPQKFTLALKINNRDHDYECEIEPIFDDNKNVNLLFIRFTDIRSFIKTQKEFENKITDDSLYKSYLFYTSSPVFVIDLDGKIIYWNNASQHLFGFTNIDAEGRSFIDLLGINEAGYFENLKQRIKELNTLKLTTQILDKTNTEAIIEMSFTLARDTEQFIVVSCQVISDRINLEKKLNNLARTFDQFIQNSDALIFTINKNGKFLQSNESFLRLLKLQRQNLSSSNIKEFIEPEYFAKTSLSKIALESAQLTRIELPLISADKRKILLLGTITPIENLDSEKVLLGSFQNITELKTISKEHKILSAVIEYSKDGIAIEHEGKLVFSNEIFAKYFGYYRKEDVLGKSFVEFLANEDVARISEYLHLIRRKLDAPNRFEFLGKKEDGSKTFYSASVSEFEIEEKSYIAYIIRDISERKRAQQALLESEEKYRSLIENIDDYFYTFSRVSNKLIPVFYTSSVRKITGYTQEEFLKDKRLYLKIILPDDISSVKKKIREYIHSRIRDVGEIEYRILNKFGNIVWVRNRITLIRDINGQIKTIYGIVSDISTRRKAEDDLQKSREDLLKLNENKDRFLSIISHDLRTPFSSILGFTELLLNDEGLSDRERKQYIQFIQESSKSMLALVNSLLDWNRLQSGRIEFEPEKIQASMVINRSINSLSAAALKKNISITSNVPESIEIFVDDNLITQVFNNLISNAIKFSHNNGSIFISVSSSKKLRFLEFSVQDTGVGIRHEDINKLFSVESKFTLEGTSGEKGSGLGLSIVNDIIQKHGGSIWVESEFGKGSTFKFTLPIASAVILLVDDSKTDRFLYSKILKNIAPDYTIETASDGKEAYDKIIKSPPALVITDHNMPAMNGIQLVQEINNLDMNIKPPVIILSGKMDRQIIEDYHTLGIEYIFQKPVNLGNFKQAIEKTIRKGLRVG
ncbi:MAG: PAS domain S-box protein [Ignavibacteriaceae bacterium]|nr:PAS domain S-box protein [Ignavibacteriaceae bacterium]